jgi:hypothetical protein
VPWFANVTYLIVNKEKTHLTAQFTLRFPCNHLSNYLSIVKIFYSKCLAQRRIEKAIGCRLNNLKVTNKAGARAKAQRRKEKNVLGHIISDRIDWIYKIIL